MTTPVAITDPTIAKAYAHPLRIQIMGLLDNRVASPSQLAAELGSPLSLTSYHVRQLASWGLVKLVRRRQVRGSVEHFYTAIVRPTLYDDAWASIPPIVKRAIIGGRIAQIGHEVGAAAKTGGFDREDIHLSRTRAALSPEGWRTVAREFADMLARIDQLRDEEAAKFKDDPHAEHVESTIVMMLFESSPPATFDAHEAGAPWQDDEVADVAPPGR
jgi:DNA-binding transcriptional ArsR family regulator